MVSDLSQLPERTERVDKMPSHMSPSEDGDVYISVNRVVYRCAVGGEYLGKEIYVMAGLLGDEIRNFDVWREVPGDDDVIVRPDDSFTFDRDGFRFYSTPRYINGG